MPKNSLQPESFPPHVRLPHGARELKTWGAQHTMKTRKPSKKTVAESIAAKAAWKKQQEAKPAPIYPRVTVTITDSSLAGLARDAARRANGRIKNWSTPCPTRVTVPLGDYDTIDLGGYSRSCKYMRYEYKPCYTSYGVIAANGAALLYRRGFAGSIKSRLLRAPAGMRWTQNNGLCLVRESDGMDYHPTVADLQSPKFATVVRDAMAANYTARLNAKREAKRAARWERQFQRDLATTRVTLHDSRKAGNCIEGSLRFAERKLGLDRASILAAGHLFSVPAKRLLAVANGETERAMAAVWAAWNRETTVSI